MTIEEFQPKLDTLLNSLSSIKFEAVEDNVISELSKYSNEAENLGLNSGKNLICNLQDALKTRKTGGNTDESVQIRLTALDFYLRSLQIGSTEEL